MKPNSLGVTVPIIHPDIYAKRISTPYTPHVPVIRATPYSLQDHSQMAAASAHQAPQVNGAGHAPAISKLGANPSSIHPSQVLGMRSLHRFMTR